MSIGSLFINPLTYYTLICLEGKRALFNDPEIRRWVLQEYLKEKILS